MKSFEEFREEQEEYLMERRGGRRPPRNQGGGRRTPRNQGGGRRGPNVGDVVGGAVGAATAPIRWGAAGLKGLADTALKTAAGQVGNLIKGKVGSTGSTHGKELQGLPKNS